MEIKKLGFRLHKKRLFNKRPLILGLSGLILVSVGAFLWISLSTEAATITSVVPNRGLASGGNRIAINGTGLGNVKNFPFNGATHNTGSAQTINITRSDGDYRFQVWGAGSANGTSRGGYATGILENLVDGDILYAYVGGTGAVSSAGGWNGGGPVRGNYGSDPAGAGATDIRLTTGAWNLLAGLQSRILVAGGAGSLVLAATNNPGFGGGASGITGQVLYTDIGANCSSGTGNRWFQGYGGSQTAGGGWKDDCAGAGGFGGAGNGSFGTGGYGGRTGGGGGWYGGGAVGIAGGGGSGYVLTTDSNKTGYCGSNIQCATIPNSKYFFNPVGMLNLDGKSTIIPNTSTGALGTNGLTGHGYARATYLGIVEIRLGGPTGPLCTNPRTVSDAQLTCNVPVNQHGGTYDIYINNGFEKITIKGGYTYDRVVSINPSYGPTDGGQQVTISGYDFLPQYSYSVTIGSSPCTNIVVVSENEITCITSPSAPGLVSVTTVIDGKTEVLPRAYVYVSDFDLDYSPRSGPEVGGTEVSISATDVDFFAKMTNISVGAQHACGLNSGKVYCWGANNNGQLGNGTGRASFVPTAVSTTVMSGTVTDISVGYDTTCAISGGNVYCWGMGTSGQLGDNTVVTKTTPVLVIAPAAAPNPAGTYTKVSVGYQHACAIAGGRAYCWGRQDNGRLGNNVATAGTINRPILTTATNMTATMVVTDISAGDTHSCAVVDPATITGISNAFCWGLNTNGGLGTNNTTQYALPTLVVGTNLSGGMFTKISAGNLFTCGIVNGGINDGVYCFGLNTSGQLGRNHTNNAATTTCPTVGTCIPDKVDNTNINSGTAIDIAAGNAYACAILGGSSYCWGINNQGQLGTGDLISRLLPTAVIQGDMLNVEYSSNTKIAVSPANDINVGIATCSITSTYVTYCWGGDNFGQLGNGSNPGTDRPVNVWAVRDVYFDETPALSYRLEFIGGKHTLIAITPYHSPDDALIRVEHLLLGDIFVGTFKFTKMFNGAKLNPDNGPTIGGTTVDITGDNIGLLGKMTKISVSATHACGIYNYRAFCWGLNGNGQLGNNSTTNSNVPIAVHTTLMDGLVTDISADYAHTCAVASGKAYCWGAQNNGRLGNGLATAVNVLTPIEVLTTAMNANSTLTGTVSSVLASGAGSCAIANNIAHCWGFSNTTNGQLGTGAVADVAFAKPIINNLLGSVTAITGTGIASAGNKCAINGNGRTFCWGLGTNGQLGNGGIVSSGAAGPQLVRGFNLLPFQIATNISSGATHTCAVIKDIFLSTSRAYCWGLQTSGGLGNGAVAAGNISIPVLATVLGADDVLQVSAGSTHTCALVDTTPSVYCFGLGTSGQLGDGTLVTSATAKAILTTNLNSLPVGLSEKSGTGTCLKANLGEAACWGLGTSGQLGNTASVNNSTPQLVSTTGSSALLAEKQIKFDGIPQQGNVLHVDDNHIKVVTPPHHGGWVDVDIFNSMYVLPKSYNYHSFELFYVNPPDGPTIGGQRVEIIGANLRQYDTGWKEVSAGGTFSCGITDENKAYCWGRNAEGQLGVGNTTTGPLTPTAVDGVFSTMKVQHISAGNNHACAVADDGWIYCWGYNNVGQLGDNTTVNKLVPTPITSTPVIVGKTFMQVSTNDQHSCALTTDGLVFCWGSPAYGRLGDGTTTGNKLTATPVSMHNPSSLFGRTVKQISVGYEHTCAVASDGTAHCWGRQLNGRLGNNASVDASLTTPIMVGTNTIGSSMIDKGVKQISAGFAHTCVIANDNTAHCFGLNTNGQLGKGTLSTANTAPLCDATGDCLPAKVMLGDISIGSTFKEVSAGYNYTCSIASDDQAYCFGLQSNGRLGIGPYITGGSISLPAAVDKTGLANLGIIKISGTSASTVSASTCSVTSHHQASCWGANTNGQLGNGATMEQSIPKPVDVSLLPKTINEPSVIFDSDTCIDAVVVSDTVIECTTPAHEVGPVDVSVTIHGEIQTLRDGYEYITTGLPTITSITPSEGMIYGGETVTINGTGLDQYGLTPQVWLAGKPCTNVIVISDIEITCVTPAHSAGVVDLALSVGGIGVQVIALANAYEYKPFLVGSISPTSGSYFGGQTVTITGRGFDSVMIAPTGFGYTGNYQTFIAPANGDYKVELWGAQGSGSTSVGGDGGYSSGTIYLTAGEILYVYVGQTGVGMAGNTTSYNGGPSSSNGTPGGGASDVRYFGSSAISTAWDDAVGLRSRIMVAGGGGSSGASKNNFGGGLTAGSGISGGGGGTQLAGGAQGGTFGAGRFGQGAQPGGAGGGGGFWGGGGNSGANGGGGGSSFISGHTGSIALASNANTNPRTGTGGVACVAGTTDNLCSQHYSGKIFTNTVMIDGIGRNWTNVVGSYTNMPHISDGADPYPLGSGKPFDGYAKITQLNTAATPVVMFGKAECVNLTVVSDTKITCTTTHSDPGLVDVSVTINRDKVSLEKAYEYYPFNISPEFGPTGGGQTVTVSNGALFSQSAKLPQWRQISSGTNHTCAILENSSEVYCWGLGSFGQLGDGTVADSNTPVRVLGDLDGIAVKEISSGSNHTCAIRTDNNQAYCWGLNSNGQLGNNAAVDQNLPTKVLGQLDGVAVKQISAGSFHTCAIRTDNSLAYCWGLNSNGQLGDNTVVQKQVPTLLAAPLNATPVNQISAGHRHTCAIRTDNSLAYCWGLNANGQLGDNTVVQKQVPTLLAAPLNATPVNQISAGGSHTCAIRAVDSQAFCWGLNVNGQIGDNTIAQKNVATAVAAPLLNIAVRQITTGNFHTCAIRNDNNQPYCWGLNTSGQIGDNTVVQKQIPTLVVNPLSTPYRQISAGANHTCAIISNTNQSYCWGINDSGQLGTTPSIIQSQWKQVSTGSTHTCAIKADDDELYCWGTNANGQLGNGTTTASTTPVRVLGALSGVPVKQVSLGSEFSCASRLDNNLAYCWGQNTSGQLGIGTVTNVAANYFPQAILGTLNGVAVKEIKAGHRNTCAIELSSDLVICWGMRDYGAVGQGATTAGTFQNSPATPVAGVLTGIPISDITVGTHFVCAIGKNNGLAYCWGYNAYGSVGDNTLTNRATPVNVIGLLNNVPIKQISAGYYQACAIRADNDQLYCWGMNDNGQLGKGNVNNSNILATQCTSYGHCTPQLVTGSLSGVAVNQVSAGTGYTCATRLDNNQAFCWGLNTSGQLGPGNAVSPVSIPIPISIPLNAPVKQIDANAYLAVATVTAHTCAIQKDTEQLFCWGITAAGSLGDSTLTSMPQTAPVAVNVSNISTNTVRVTLGGAECINIKIISDTELTCVTSPHAAGLVDVTVMVGERVIGVTKTLIDGYEYTDLTFTVSSITPNIGINTGGTELIISGEGFGEMSGPSQSTVNVVMDKDGTPAICTVTTWTDTEIRCTTSAHVPGPVDVTITIDSQTLTRPDAFTYYSFTLDSIGPNTGSITGGQTVTITGSGLDQGVTPTITFDGIPCTDVTVISDTEITCVTPAHVEGSVEVAVTINGETHSLTNGHGYTYVAPRINSVSPRRGSTLGGTEITIQGEYFGDIEQEIVLDMNGTPAICEITFWSDTMITCTTSAHIAGTVDVSIVIGSDDYTLTDGFTYVDTYINLGIDADYLKIGGLDGLSLSQPYDFVSNTASVTTNMDGFNLLISTNSNSNNSMNHTILPASIGPTSGTWTARTPLAVNTWGFTTISNPSDTANIWSAVPNQTSPLTIKSTTTPIETIPGDQTTIFYGAKIDISRAAGVYQAIVVYTAVGKL